MKEYRFNVPQWIFLAIFTLSGFAGLIYESIWSHYLKLFLGHAAYAQALVLAIFMGGMAAGAALAARYSLKVHHALLGYALIEGLIGLVALGFHRVFLASTGWAYDSLLPGMGNPQLIEFVKWTLAAGLILPQSLLLGSTFPLMSAGLIRRAPTQAGYNLSMLYFTNSLGAAVGVLVSGFVLIEAVGLPGTLFTAGLINILLALLVWLLARADERERHLPAVPDIYAAMSAQPASRAFVSVLLLATFAGSAASFFYEIGWIRMLSLVLGAATHSFELMLSAFILGLALGGFLIRKRIDAFRQPLLALVIIQLLMGLSAALTIPLYGETFGLMGWVMDALNKNASGYVLFSGAKHLIALLIMLPTTVLAGMTLPLITHMLLKAGQGERVIGKVYAINTLGAIAGIVLASLIVLPTLGLRSVLLLGALGDILVGVLLLLLWRRQATSPAMPSLRTPALIAAGALVGWLVIGVFLPFNPMLLSSGVYRFGQAAIDDRDQRELIQHLDGATATITTVRIPEPDGETLGIATNGKSDASISTSAHPLSDELTMIATATLPLAVHPAPREVAIIGFGSGYTSHVLLGDPELTRVDTIEIEPRMVEAARHAFGPYLPRVYEDPRSQIIFNDAKTHFSTHRSRYDIIIAEPSNPWVSGVASLFSREFYARVTQHLNPGGVYAQWIQGYEISLPLASTVFAALLSEFDDVQLFNLGNNDYILLARPDGRLPDLSARPFELPAVREALVRVGVPGVAELKMRRVAGRETLIYLSYAMGAEPNSDFSPWLDIGAEKARFMREDIGATLRLRTFGYLMLEQLDGMAPLQNLAPPADDISGWGPLVRSAQAFTQALETWAATGALPPFAADGGLSEVEYRKLQQLLDPDACQPQTAASWLDDIHTVLRTALAFADVGQLVPATTALTAHSCVSMNATAKTWMELYAALSAREHERILHYGLVLLESPHVPASDKRWASFPAAVAGLARHDRVASRLWRAYRGQHAEYEIERWVLDYMVTFDRYQ